VGSTAKSSTSPVNSVKQLYPPIPVNTIPDNVVYIITSPVHRKLQTYIIGASISKEIATALRCKAQTMKSRLSNYNKSMEHEVVYYVKCHTGKIAQLVESMVLTRLHKYREVVNRDRIVKLSQIVTIC